MSHLDRQGPENNGPRTGRKLGKCKSVETSEFELGIGMGARRNAHDKCDGKGKRIKSGKMFNK